MKKKLIYLIFLLFFAGFASSLYLYFTGFDLRHFLEHTKLTTEHKILILFLLYFFRNYFFLPSTITILATGFLLKDFYLTLIVSVVGVASGIAQTYFVGYLFGENLREKKEFSLIKRYEEKIKKDGFKVIFLGSFFPIIPVDILYYAAGFVKYNFYRFFLAGFLGELPLIILYSYLGIQAEKYMKYLGSIIVGVFVIFMIYWYFKKKFFSENKIN